METHFTPRGQTARWTTTLSSKVNLPRAIDIRASCGANLVTYCLNFRGNKTLEVNRVDTDSRMTVRLNGVSLAGQSGRSRPETMLTSIYFGHLMTPPGILSSRYA